MYLYLINYAKTQPELAMLAVNTFVKDANDSVRVPYPSLPPLFNAYVSSLCRTPSSERCPSELWGASA